MEGFSPNVSECYLEPCLWVLEAVEKYLGSPLFAGGHCWGGEMGVRRVSSLLPAWQGQPLGATSPPICCLKFRPTPLCRFFPPFPRQRPSTAGCWLLGLGVCVFLVGGGLVPVRYDCKGCSVMLFAKCLCSEHLQPGHLGYAQYRFLGSGRGRWIRVPGS